MWQLLFAMVRSSGLQRAAQVTVLFGVGALTALLHSPAWAQDAAYNPRTSGTSTQGWQVRPMLSVSEHYSDNISLAPSGSARSEWTTRISPGVSVSGNSARLHFNATYTPELLYRVNQATTDVSHALNALGNAELLSRTLFVDVRANVSQQNVSLLGPQAESNVNTTTNRTSVKSYGISPYLRHDFGFDAFGELRFTHDAVHLGGNSGGVSSSTSERVDAKLTSGPAYKLFTWNLAFSKSHVEYTQTGQKIDEKNVSASVGRLITPEIRLNVNAGYEDSGYPSTTGQELKGAFWSVGPAWTPSERTRVAATFGRRYFGPWRTFQLEHRSRLTSWGLDYSENVTNTRSSLTVPVTLDTAAILNALFLSQFPDPIVRQAMIQQFIVNNGLPASLNQPLNFLTDSLFLDKRLQATFGIHGIRNTVLTSVFSSNRNALTTGSGVGNDFNSSQNVKQTGASMSWSLRLTESLASNVSLAVTRNAFTDLNRTDRLTALRWGLTKDFDPKVTGSLSLGRVKNDSDAVSTSYTENSVAATLGMRF